MKKNIQNFFSAATLLTVFVSCSSDKSKPGYEYMPDMYRGPAIEAYSASENFTNSLTALKPVDGTIPRGFDLYSYEDTPEGYELAKAELKMPEMYKLDSVAEARTAQIEESKELYTIFCSACHGEKGNGQGKLVQNEKILGVPSYASSARPGLTEGSIYHVIHYGKGIMGSHASQMSQEERWKVTNYVIELRKTLDASEAN
jgi:mono/diheme cytochrome c family protein